MSGYQATKLSSYHQDSSELGSYWISLPLLFRKQTIMESSTTTDSRIRQVRDKTSRRPISSSQADYIYLHPPLAIRFAFTFLLHCSYPFLNIFYSISFHFLHLYDIIIVLILIMDLELNFRISAFQAAEISSPYNTNDGPSYCCCCCSWCILLRFCLDKEQHSQRTSSTCARRGRRRLLLPMATTTAAEKAPPEQSHNKLNNNSRRL